MTAPTSIGSCSSFISCLTSVGVGVGVGVVCLCILKQLGQLPYTHLITRLLKLCPALCHELVASGYCTNSCKLQKVHVFLISSTSSTCIPFKASHCIHCIFHMNSCSTVFDLNPPVIIFQCLSLASS